MGLAVLDARVRCYGTNERRVADKDGTAVRGVALVNALLRTGSVVLLSTGDARSDCETGKQSVPIQQCNGRPWRKGRKKQCAALLVNRGCGQLVADVRRAIRGRKAVIQKTPGPQCQSRTVEAI